MVECVACDRKIRVSVTLGDSVFQFTKRYNMCHLHADMLNSPELVDDFARYIYIEDYLIPRKEKEERWKIWLGSGKKEMQRPNVR